MRILYLLYIVTALLRYLRRTADPDLRFCGSAVLRRYRESAVTIYIVYQPSDARGNGKGKVTTNNIIKEVQKTTRNHNRKINLKIFSSK